MRGRDQRGKIADGDGVVLHTGSNNIRGKGDDIGHEMIFLEGGEPGREALGPILRKPNNRACNHGST